MANVATSPPADDKFRSVGLVRGTSTPQSHRRRERDGYVRWADGRLSRTCVRSAVPPFWRGDLGGPSGGVFGRRLRIHRASCLERVRVPDRHVAVRQRMHPERRRRVLRRRPRRDEQLLHQRRRGRLLRQLFGGLCGRVSCRSDRSVLLLRERHRRQQRLSCRAAPLRSFVLARRPPLLPARIEQRVVPGDELGPVRLHPGASGRRRLRGVPHDRPLQQLPRRFVLSRRPLRRGRLHTERGLRVLVRLDGRRGHLRGRPPRLDARVRSDGKLGRERVLPVVGRVHGRDGNRFARVVHRPGHDGLPRDHRGAGGHPGPSVLSGTDVPRGRRVRRRLVRGRRDVPAVTCTAHRGVARARRRGRPLTARART
jgi:hypothetical protein